jgi:ATP-binding cassette, subfamily B, bacterial
MSDKQKQLEEERKKAKGAQIAADAKSPPPEEDDDEEDDDEEEDDEEEESEIPNYTAKEAVGAFGTVFYFILPFLKNHKRGLTFVGIGLLIETAFNVMMPLSLKYLIDEVFEEGNKSELIWILSVLGVAGIITSIAAIWYEKKDALVTSAIMADVHMRLFKYIQNLPVSFYSKTKKGALLSRFSNDMNTLEMSVIYSANWFVLPLMELMAGLVLLFVLNTYLAMIALLIFPLVLIGPRLIAPYALNASYMLKHRQAESLGVVQENIGGQTVIKAFSLQKYSIDAYTVRNHAVREAQTKTTFLETMVERSITITVLLLHLIVFAAGAYLAFEQKISVGTFIAFEAVFWEISYNIAHVTQYIPVVINGAGATHHIQEIMNEPQRFSDKEGAYEMPAFKENITFEKAIFSYDGTVNQLHGLDLTFEAGKRIAIVGPSGAGKSTLLNLILRLYDPKSGRILIDGHNIAGVTRESLRAQMAIVFQENLLFNTTFRENIRLGDLNATNKQVEDAAKAAEIHKFIKGLPQGYDTLVGERGDTLSGGQRQRIAIARALVRNPPILLLDEATSALDQTTESSINKTLKKIGNGRTVLFVTHRLTSVVDMDEIIVMDDGKLKERGTHAELLEKKGLYAKLWNDQMKASGH